MPGGFVRPAAGSIPSGTVMTSSFSSTPLGGGPRPLPQAQTPSPFQSPPATPQPNATAPAQPASPGGAALSPMQAAAALPSPEQKTLLDVGSVTLKRTNGSWQVWAGPRVFKDTGSDETGARDIVRVLRELHPTEWVSLGSPHPVVEYGLINGRPANIGGFPRMIVPIDLRTVRAQMIRGVWCVRDDGNILFNFGADKTDADQAVAVIRKYGFNRVGLVGGSIRTPAMTYLFVAPDSDGAPPPAVNPLVAAAQENALTRTGIPVPGVGYIGEMVKFDPRKVTSHREPNGEWVVTDGQNILARCGTWEWTARQVVRTIQDGRFTEFCTVGSVGITFFLVNGKAPTQIPLVVQNRRFDLGTVKAQKVGERWIITENDRHLFDVSGPDEGEAIVRLLRHFRFDQICQIGTPPQTGVMFMARSR